VKEHIELLVESLRQELQQYGEMLALLDRQQELVIRRESDDVLDSVSRIEAQGAAIQSARNHREARRRRMAQAAGLLPESSLAELLPRLPANYRPLVCALVDENNTLIHRVQQRSRQNHLLLSKALELMKNLFGSLFPSSGTLTYSGAGLVNGALLSPRSLYEAVG
jgi:flagellar biosynthesis/type III secretory pathway chaperone